MPKKPVKSKQFVAIRWPEHWRWDLKAAAAKEKCSMGLYVQRCYLCAQAVGGLDVLEALCQKHQGRKRP